MILGASALGAVELAGRELPGTPPAGTPQKLRPDSPTFNNAFTALWGYANWGGARWAYPFIRASGSIYVDWSGNFYSGDGNMTGGFWG